MQVWTKNIQKKFKISFLVMALIPITANAENQVSILTKLSPAGSFTAISDKLKGEVIKKGTDVSAENLSVSIDSFKTDNNLRDEHMHKHFNSDKFPQAILTEFKGKAGKATGMLEVNGVKKLVEIQYSEKSNQLIATMELKSSDFGLVKAKYLGIGVKDEVKVDVKVDLKLSDASSK